MSSQERPFLVSNDSSGLLGVPSVWRQVWSSAFEKSNFKGFEMIGWGGKLQAWTELLIKQAQKNNCNIVGMHGRIGNENTHDPLKNLKALIGNNLIIDTPSLVSKYGSKLEYILLHAPELETQKVSDIVVKNKKQIKKIYIENHLNNESLGRTIEITNNLRYQGVNAGIMFDLFHYYNSHNSALPAWQRWRELMNQTKKIIESVHLVQKVPIGFHVPVGINLIDSFPKEINTQMWGDLSAILAGYPEIMVVFENRQKGVNQLILPSKQIELQKQRNQIIIDSFSDIKLI